MILLLDNEVETVQYPYFENPYICCLALQSLNGGDGLDFNEIASD